MTTNHRMTNYEFADAIDCDFTMASRLRSGDRLPSRELLIRIVKAYNLDANDALDACEQGAKAFAEYLDEMVFNPPTQADDPDENEQAAEEIIEDVINDAANE